MNTISGNKTTADDPVLKNQDQVYTTAKEKAELLSQTLANKCQMEDAYDPAPDVHNSTQHTTDKITFKFKDVKRILRNLSLDKATSPDEIPIRALKECNAEVPLNDIFEFCFSQAVFPRQWKSATVIPIHKEKSKSNPIMYRPIPLPNITLQKKFLLTCLQHKYFQSLIPPQDIDK